MALRIDAHQHYWRPERGDYGWMPPDNPVLTRTYAPRDLEPIMKQAKIDATVLVQAAPTVAETEYMLGIADATPSVGKVVGWIDFEKPDDRRHLERLKHHPKFAGVRPMIQDIADDGWMLRADVQWAYEALVELDLTFDALGFSRHLKNFLTILTRYPDMRAVIDHCMKPQIRDHGTARDEFRFWADGMSLLARETNACCKLSGIVTEANAGWTVDDLRPYVEHVLETFGPERVMWGSDWPVCRLRAEHNEWRGAAEILCQGLSAPERISVFGGTAACFYRIG
jgi:L-fuconolactonase